MRIILAILHFFLPAPLTASSVDTRLENAVFDLTQAGRDNVATTKLLGDLLKRNAQH